MKSNAIIDVIFRDLLCNMLLGIVLAALLMLNWINDPTRADDYSPPGEIRINICWLGDADVDLWSLAPGDAPVGFRRKAGKVFALLRDDVGAEGKPAEKNCEEAVARSLPAGQWLVNVHLYSTRVEPPVAVKFEVVRTVDGATTMLREGVKELRSVGDERTIIRFRTDHLGNIVPGSVGDIQEMMRR